MTRTYSKTWAMAGARLGYLVGPSWLVAELEKVALPYHLDALKQAVGIAALEFVDDMQARVGAIVAERTRLTDRLGGLAVDVWPSGANFVLMRPRGRDGAEVWKQLVDRSVLVRNCSSWPRLDGCLRVTVGTPDRRMTASWPPSRRFWREPLCLVPSRGAQHQGDPDMSRTSTRSRSTKETRIEVSLDLDGDGKTETSTGLPFFDHMLDQLGRHGGLGLTVRAQGDLAVDAHHTVEDTGIILGEAFREALGDKAGVRRFASITVPLDEAAVEVVLDLSGRPFLHYDVDFPGEKILGDPPFDPQLAEEFWRAFATAAAITLHIVMRRGRNTHHIVEASFKGVARAIRDAVRVEGSALPSTKGTL